MAKSKANPALAIWIWKGYASHPAVALLRDAGHNIIELDDMPPADLIFHPAAHRWDDTMWESPYLKAALMHGRKLHRARNEKTQ